MMKSWSILFSKFNLEMDSKPQNLGVILLSILFGIGNVGTKHVCNNYDLTGFCLITRQFKEITLKHNPPAYPQFKKILELFPDKPYISGLRTYEGTTFFTYQDLCENKWMYAGDYAGKENPYDLTVTEIHVKGQRLHNWLHLKIKADKGRLGLVNAGLAGDKIVTGKVKMAFLLVTDQNSKPVGDFNHAIQGGSDCNCKYFIPPKADRDKDPQCHQGNQNDHVPCMFTDDKVVSHPGQMMFYDEEGVEEIHASWHFAQSQKPENFVSELHFRGLLIENNITRTGPQFLEDILRGESNNDVRQGIYGWNPQYKILLPTAKTVGGWDYFRRRVYSQNDIQCHMNISEDHYIIKEYPTIGKVYPITKGSTKEDTEAAADNYWHNRDKTKEKGPFGKDGMVGARHNEYSGLDAPYDVPLAPQLYHGIIKKHPNNDTSDKAPPNFFAKEKDIERRKLEGFTKVEPRLMFWERCVCPAIPTTHLPEDVPPPRTQIQGRKSHALQMIIAWLCIIPFGIFVSRFYKETFSQVFFLQEFWWYTIHVLCMFTALMFMWGGIYAIEIKRQEPLKLTDPKIVVHVIFGGAAMGIFTLHAIFGFFRFRNLQYRLTQILGHWLFGHFECMLAIASMFTSSFIIQGCFPCGSVGILVVWTILQIILYVGMEIHMRRTDKKINLKPKRSYLPPPVMRLFHENAPDSKFRMIVLGGYAILCLCSSIGVQLIIKYSDEGQSCFKRSIAEDG